MKEFKDRVAVITGAASGIGRALAQRSAREGMKVVLADVEKEALDQTEKEMKNSGANVLAVLTDVSKAHDVEMLARKTVNAFGSVHLLFNNAGVVGEVTSIWKSTLADWEWVMGVNLWGVVHGIRTFVPIMLEQDTECHIVNTASAAALTHGPGGLYGVSKHAVVGLSETLYRELKYKKSKIDVSVFCPGFVSTRIMDSDRNRPAHLQNDSAKDKKRPEFDMLEQARRKIVQAGIPASQAADIIFNAVMEEQFYILSDPETKTLVRQRMEDILEQRNPGGPS